MKMSQTTCGSPEAYRTRDNRWWNKTYIILAGSSAYKGWTRPRPVTSLVCPLFSIDNVLGLSFILLFSLVELHPTPNIVPIKMSGQICCLCGHISFIFSHINWQAVLLHLRRMCCIDSILSHSEQIALSLYPGTLFHLLPILYALCIVLYRNCCTHGLNTSFLRLFHIVVSISLVLLNSSITFLVFLRYSLLRQTTLAIWIGSWTYTVHSSSYQVLQYIYCFKLLPVASYELPRCLDSFLIAAFSCL